MARLLDADTGRVLFERLRVADTFGSRAIGLLGVSSLADDQALLIHPCTSIHTFGMRMTIHVAYCDAEGTVLKVSEGVRPWRLGFGARGGKTVLEWSAEAEVRVRVGQRVRVEDQRG